MKALLDTNLLVAEKLSHPGYDIAVSSLSWAELGYGIRKESDPVERARREVRVTRLRSDDRRDCGSQRRCGHDTKPKSRHRTGRLCHGRCSLILPPETSKKSLCC